jgi:hypothetical protein
LRMTHNSHLLTHIARQKCAVHIPARLPAALRIGIPRVLHLMHLCKVN